MKRKYDRIAAQLLADIEIGKYGQRLPGVRTLAAEYDVNFKTAARAVQELADRGVVRPERGRGPCILRGRRAGSSGLPTVAVLSPHAGHFYEGLARELSTQLRRAGFAARFPDSTDYECYPETAPALLGQLLAERPTAAIIAGGARFPYGEFLARENDLPRLLFLGSTFGVEFNADYVLSDAWLGSYQVVRYLLELGHRRILLVLPRWRPPPAIFRFSEYHDYLIAYRAALEEFGAAGEERVIYEDLQTETTCEAAVREALLGPDRPTAIFGLGDFRCVRVYRVAAQLGLRIPDDLSVIGYLDTPWARQLSPPMTSVSVNPDQIAAEVVSRLSYNGPRRTRIRIPPTLVHRQSCAPPPVSA